MAPIARDVFLVLVGGFLVIAWQFFTHRMDRRRDERTLRKHTNREG